MGIRHLETFQKQFVPDGVHNISVVDECLRYQSNNNGKKPILVIDLMGLVNAFSSDLVLMLYGGRHKQLRLDFELFLKKLSESADLVFFEDGPVISQKFETWRARQNDKYNQMIEVIDQVYQGFPLTEIAKNVWNIPTVTSFLPMIEATAKKFGKLIVTVTKECDAELVQYANKNPSVLAIMTDDSDFLIFSGSWRYFSLRTLDKESLVTIEYDRNALRNCLRLNDLQLRVLSTLGGNDIIHYDEVKAFHEYNNGCGNRAQYKFPWLARFIKNRMPPNQYVVEWIAQEVLQDNSEETRNRIQESLLQYKTNFEIPIITDPLLKYCRENYYSFTFSTLLMLPKNMTIVYYDMRVQEYPDHFRAATNNFCKAVGILLQHKNQKITCEIGSKMSHNEEYQKYNVEPIYPKETVPPLLEFLNRAEFPQHDRLRFKLLKWLIDEEKLENCDLEAIPADYFFDILTLTWLVSNGFISVAEADLILLTIKHVVLNMEPQDLQPPPVVHYRAFHIAFLYTKFHSSLRADLQVTGLKESTMSLQNFDGVLFHHLYLKMVQGFDPSPFLLDLNPYRFYV